MNGINARKSMVRLVKSIWNVVTVRVESPVTWISAASTSTCPPCTLPDGQDRKCVYIKELYRALGEQRTTATSNVIIGQQIDRVYVILFSSTPLLIYLYNNKVFFISYCRLGMEILPTGRGSKGGTPSAGKPVASDAKKLFSTNLT